MVSSTLLYKPNPLKRMLTEGMLLQCGRIGHVHPAALHRSCRPAQAKGPA
jgi:hypothetical protein